MTFLMRTRPLGLRRSLRILTAALVLPLVASCVSSKAPSPDDAPLLVAVTPREGGPEVITTRDERDALQEFFSRENLRATNFSGDTSPRLTAPAGGERNGVLNTSSVNTSGRQGSNTEFQMEISSENFVIAPLRRQQIIGGEWQGEIDRGGRVALNYENAPLRTVVEDVLGGILAVNYVVSDAVEGTITFQSERRFSRTDLLQILSDILARNGYLIQYFNTVYHVGPPDELDTLTGLRGRTGLENDQTRVIRLGGTPPDNIVEIAAALVPPGNTITALEGTNDIVVRGDPSQFASIEELVNTLTGNGTRPQILTLLPLRRAAPELVADQLASTFAASEQTNAVFVPIEQRQAVLVIAESRRTIREVRQLAAELDVDTRDQTSLRIIQLAHLDAVDTAAQLNQVFGDDAAEAPSAATEGDSLSNIVAAARAQANAGESARGVTSSGDQIAAPVILRGDRSADAGTGDRQGAGDSPRTVAAGGNATPISIVADPRNNALLVQSSFKDFRRINDVVRTLDSAPSQVVIEATILEVNINDALQYGVQAYLQKQGLSVRSSLDGTAQDPGGAGFAAVIEDVRGNSNVQFVVSALQSATDVKVISSPYLTVTNGGTARLAVGDQVPFVVASQSSSSGGTVTVTQEVSSRDVGVILDVSPKISPANIVTLDINQQISSAVNTQTNLGNNPTISQRSVSSQINVASGRTVLLGGLIQERSDTGETGVPVVSKIPVVGNLFKQKADTQTRSELLIMITPRVVRNTNQLADLTRQLKVISASR